MRSSSGSRRDSLHIDTPGCTELEGPLLGGPVLGGPVVGGPVVGGPVVGETDGTLGGGPAGFPLNGPVEVPECGAGKPVGGPTGGPEEGAGAPLATSGEGTLVFLGPGSTYKIIYCSSVGSVKEV